MRRTRRPSGMVAAALAVALAAAGCTGSSSGAGATRTPDAAQASAAKEVPSGQAGLAKFYDQKLHWTQCQSFLCTRLQVPVDYAKPDGATIELAVLKVPADASGGTQHTLVVNPGGPGGSGVQYAEQAQYVASANVRRTYDIVGFDPRGVGSSAPIKCLDDAQLDQFLGSDPTPDDKAEEVQFEDTAKTFAHACAVNGGALLGHVSTIEAAKDMDVLRAALGETKLDYLGKSYGTFLGATYADLFPKNVGRFVLDGVVAPDLTSDQVNEGQAVGFEDATRDYVKDCVTRGSCPLGSSVDAGMQRLRDFLKQLDAKPIPVDNDPRVRALSEGWGSLGIAGAMYDQRQWPSLTDALATAFNGNGDALMRLADNYADRRPDGTYDGNLMQVIYAVNCLDRADSSSLAHYQTQARFDEQKAPTWGSFLAWSSLPCGFWPVPANNAPKKITAAGSGPILVVGTTRDPATPYAWSQQLAAQLQNGHLLTYDGDGHTAYMRSNSCLNDAVDAYLLKGGVPKAGTTC